MVHHFTILGIESSCDETALAVLQGHPETGVRIIAETLYSQTLQHKDFGGVVPEIAARAHLDRIADLLNQTMRQAGLSYTDLDAVAATAGPGLIGGVIVGLTVAKGIC